MLSIPAYTRTFNFLVTIFPATEIPGVFGAEVVVLNPFQSGENVVFPTILPAQRTSTTSNTMSNLGDKNKVVNAAIDDDEPDEW